MFLFKKKPKSFLGVDIGASSVKLVELAKEGERYELKNYAIFPLKKYPEQSGKTDSGVSLVIPNEIAAEAIRRSVKEAGIETKAAFLSVPSSFSFSVLVDFPDMPDKEIASAIPSEAKKYVPIPLSEIALDWSVLKPLPGTAGRQVLMVAVPKEIIKDYNQIVKLTGLNFQSAEGEVFSLKRALVGNDKSTIILIDAGARSVGVSIIDEGDVRVAYSLNFGGLRVTPRNARPAEAASGGGGGIKPDLGSVAVEIKKISDTYQEKNRRRIGKCILTGGNARLSDFVSRLQSQLSMDMSLGNPFARVICPPGSKAILGKLGAILAVAAGSAMK